MREGPPGLRQPATSQCAKHGSGSCAWLGACQAAGSRGARGRAEPPRVSARRRCCAPHLKLDRQLSRPSPAISQGAPHGDRQAHGSQRTALCGPARHAWPRTRVLARRVAAAVAQPHVQTRLPRREGLAARHAAADPGHGRVQHAWRCGEGCRREVRTGSRGLEWAAPRRRTAQARAEVGRAARAYWAGPRPPGRCRTVHEEHHVSRARPWDALHAQQIAVLRGHGVQLRGVAGGADDGQRVAGRLCRAGGAKMGTRAGTREGMGGQGRSHWSDATTLVRYDCAPRPGPSAPPALTRPREGLRRAGHQAAGAARADQAAAGQRGGGRSGGAGHVGGAREVALRGAERGSGIRQRTDRPCQDAQASSSAAPASPRPPPQRTMPPCAL
jgi:hypothetical protein